MKIKIEIAQERFAGENKVISCYIYYNNKKLERTYTIDKDLFFEDIIEFVKNEFVKERNSIINKSAEVEI